MSFLEDETSDEIVRVLNERKWELLNLLKENREEMNFNQIMATAHWIGQFDVAISVMEHLNFVQDPMELYSEEESYVETL